MSVVVTTLQAEYTRMLIKLDGATKRLTYAHSQAEAEERLMAAHKADLDMLADAILSAGGVLPVLTHEAGEAP